MATVFLDLKDFFWIEHKNKGATINAKSKASTLRNLKEKIKEERQDKLAAGVLLLYDKAPVDTMHVTKAVALDCGCINIIQLADLTPRLALVLKFKKYLRGKRFVDESAIPHLFRKRIKI